MISAPNFAPRWASPPGETIREALGDRSLSVDEFASMLGWSPRRTAALLEGSEAISLDIARSLVDVIGGSVQFWMSRDAQYRDDVARVEADAWAETLPTKEMRSYGWLPSTSSWQGRLEACLDFFDVPDVATWRATYGTMITEAKFRTSPTARTSETAVAVWLRQAEIQASGIERPRWNRERFRRILEEVRGLTLEKDPRVFLPQLRALCLSAGVALVVLPTPKGCPASGVARFMGDSGPIIVLSGRYLADDHLWFTFFHEAAHLLLHDESEVFVDELTKGSEAKSATEIEADEFSEDLLFPAQFRNSLPAGSISVRDVIRLGKKVGVSPGVLVGQLQFRGRLRYDQLNGLKRRFKWVGTTLEMA